MCACPTCLAMGGSVALGISTFLGSYIGIKPPESNKAKMLSLLGSVSLVALTTFSLKSALDFSICGGYGASFTGMSFIALWTVPMTVIYLIGINYLIQRFSSTKSCASHSCSCQVTHEH